MQRSHCAITNIEQEHPAASGYQRTGLCSCSADLGRTRPAQQNADVLLVGQVCRIRLFLKPRPDSVVDHRISIEIAESGKRQCEYQACKYGFLLRHALNPFRADIPGIVSPVAPIAPGILVMPMVGTIDTRRASRFIETLLGAISAHDAQIVLIDISAVAVVDTSVANAIIQAGQAARMLGAEMVLVGITPAVAQTMVHLGIALTQMTTRADLESGFAYALARLKRRIVTVQ